MGGAGEVGGVLSPMAPSEICPQTDSKPFFTYAEKYSLAPQASEPK